MDILVGLLICLTPATLGILLFGVDNYLTIHPEFIQKFKERLGRQ